MFSLLPRVLFPRRSGVDKPITAVEIFTTCPAHLSLKLCKAADVAFCSDDDYRLCVARGRQMDCKEVSPLAVRAFGSSAVMSNDIAHLSSSRAYAHPEEAYDAQYDNEPLDLAPGVRLVELLKGVGVSEGARLLEIGCGSGFLSLGMASTNHFGEMAVTDGSLSFMRLTKRKFEKVETTSSLCLAVLTDADTDKIAADYFNVIAMRSVLHHVEDFGAFADLLLEKLKPGGVLAMYEPRAELFLWMGTVMALFSELAGANGVALDEEEQASIVIFIKTMEFYLRRDIDKSSGEDKHAFWQHELLNIATRNQAQTFYQSENESTDLVEQLLDYCRYCMSFSPALVDKMRQALTGLSLIVSRFVQGVQPPDLAGWYLFRKS